MSIEAIFADALAAVNSKLAIGGTSLSLLGQGAAKALQTMEADPGTSIAQIAEVGAEVAFPEFAGLIELAPLLIAVAQAAGMKPAPNSALVYERQGDDPYVSGYEKTNPVTAK